MNVLLVYAHPEPTSLNGALKDFSVKRLEAADLGVARGESSIEAARVYLPGRTKQTQIFATNLGSWVLPGALCAALYLAMSLPLSTLARRLEERWKRPTD